MILILGGGDIAEKGIVPVVGGTIIPPDDCDVTHYATVRHVIHTHHPDVIVNCAGVSHPATILSGHHTDWLDEIHVNLIGSYNIAKAAVDHGVPTLIFIASVAGLYGKPNHSGYSVSKSGVITLVQSLAMEGHYAYAISPGRVDTAMRERDFPGEDPLTRLPPVEIGHVIRGILDGAYTPGDNIIIRKIGYQQHMRVDKGEPWRSWLHVGEPSLI